VPDYQRVRAAWNNLQNVPLSPAYILVDDIEKVVIEMVEVPIYTISQFPPSHHAD